VIPKGYFGTEPITIKLRTREKTSNSQPIGHVYQYFNIDPRLSGQNCNFFKFPLSFNSKRDLDIRKTPPNIEVCPENLRAMLEH